MKRRRSLSYAEYVKMKMLYEEGYSISRIAKELGRSDSIVRRWLKRKPRHVEIIENMRRMMREEAVKYTKGEVCLSFICGLIDSDGLIRLNNKVKCIEVKTSTDEVYIYAFRIKKVFEAASRFLGMDRVRITPKPSGGGRWRIYIFFEDEEDLVKLYRYVNDKKFRKKIENSFTLLKYYLLAYIDGDGAYDNTGIKISVGGDKEKERLKRLLYNLGVKHIYERLKYRKGEKLEIEGRTVNVKKNNYDLWINKTEYKYRIGTSIKELKKTKPELNKPEKLEN